MYDYQIALGAIASGIGILAFVPYFRDIIRGTTKPHPFSWLVWGLIHVIAFFAQVSSGGGAGTWLTASVAIGCLVIAALSFFRGKDGIVALDWWCLIGALLGVVLWQVTNNPFTAIIFVILTDALACVPTFRKGYLKPNEETVLTYGIGVLANILALFAFESINPTTVLYPIFIVVINIALVAMLLIRRKQLARSMIAD